MNINEGRGCLIVCLFIEQHLQYSLKQELFSVLIAEHKVSINAVAMVTIM